MSSPFPGMDPYLEHPNLWPDAHGRLLAEFSDLLMPSLVPKYIARLDTHVTVDKVTDPNEITVIVPDVAVLERPSAPDMSRPGGGAMVAFAPTTRHTTNILELPVRQSTLEIRTASDERLVTVIELLSPINKRSSDNRYPRKRARLLRAGVHLLEIDLLRRGQRVQVGDPLDDAPYFVLLSRWNRKPHCDVWAIQLDDALPVVPVPLLDDDPDVPLDLGAALASIYHRARYDLSVDYTADPFPPLSDEDAAWADVLLREKGLRS